MAASVTFNPVQTTNAIGSFTAESGGDVQGEMLDDPALRYELMGGVLLSTETLPMWGGVFVFENIPNPIVTQPNPTLGCPVGRATSITGGAAPGSAFTVFNQAHAMVNSPQSPVPLAGSGMSVNYVRLGSGLRIAVAIDPALASLDGGLVGQQVSWDFAQQRLIPFTAAYGAVAFTSLSFNATTGSATGTTASPHGLAVGTDFTIIGAVPAAWNGTYTALTGTTGSVVIFKPASNPGAVTTQGTIAAGGGALPCKINRISTGNSMVVVYDPVTGFATWNRSGSTAIIQI